MTFGMRVCRGSLKWVALFHRSHLYLVIVAGRACNAIPTYARPATSMLVGAGESRRFIGAGNVAPPDARMLSIRSSPCAVPRIIRLSKVPDLKSILKSFAIAWKATALFLSRRNSSRLRLMKLVYDGLIATYVRPRSFSKMDFQSERSPPR
jgi:hypothetical protein